MEYKNVVALFKKLTKKDEDSIENCLGYLFYEDENSQEVMPIEQDDLTTTLETATDITFGLQEGESLEDAAKNAAADAKLNEFGDITTLFVRFIAGPSTTDEDAIRAFSAIEPMFNGSFPADVLLGLTVDEEFDGQFAVALVAVEHELDESQETEAN